PRQRLELLLRLGQLIAGRGQLVLQDLQLLSHLHNGANVDHGHRRVADRGAQDARECANKYVGYFHDDFSDVRNEGSHCRGSGPVRAMSRCSSSTVLARPEMTFSSASNPLRSSWQTTE